MTQEDEVEELEPALIEAARLQAEYHNALVDLRDAAAKHAPAVVFDAELFTLSTKGYESLTALSKKLGIEIPDEFEE